MDSEGEREIRSDSDTKGARNKQEGVGGGVVGCWGAFPVARYSIVSGEQEPSRSFSQGGSLIV